MEDQGQDKMVTCVDCGAEFAFSARDQAFYQERGYQAPRRCKTCRDKRKNAQGGGGGSGHASDSGLNQQTGGGGYGQRSGGGGSGYGQRSGGGSGGQYGGGQSYGQQQHGQKSPGNYQRSPGNAPAPAPDANQFKVTCTGCGVETTVPFKPNPNRPVYCRTCYLSKRK
jgi:CxxC-x17-CxxC domain-containing protein